MGETTLKHKAFRGIAWSAVDKMAVKGINFLISIVIARILSPSDYGIIGMVMVFILVSSLFADSGFSQALVQKKDRTQADMSTAFFFNILVAVCCYALLFVAAPFVAQFYEMPLLVPVLRILGINVIIISLGTVQRANLLIRIDFRTLAIVNVLSAAISGVVGVSMAYNGYGVWSLVGQMLVMQVSSAFLLWVLGQWKPGLEFSKASMYRLWDFGSKLLTAGMVATIMREIYSIVIGKFYRSAELGYYHRAVHTTEVISGTINEIVNVSTFPILSSIQDDRQRLISVYSRLLSMTAFIVFPIMALLALVASPLVSVLLTDKWLPAVVLIQWLCMARMFTPISALNMNILNAVGRSDLFLKVDLSKLPITILVMIITLPISVKAVVIGNFVDTFICYFINAYLPGRLFNFGVKAQFKIFRSIILSTMVMACAAYMAMQLVESPLPQLLLGGIVGVVAYLFVSYIQKSPELKEIYLQIQKRRNVK